MQRRCARTRETNAIARRHCCCGLQACCPVTFLRAAHLYERRKQIGRAKPTLAHGLLSFSAVEEETVFTTLYL
jgi:hypothetical protein